MAKKIPYGISDFIKMVTRNYYYVDKTMYIPQLEDIADYIFFIRPRRFGKSLWLNMLTTYYDCLFKGRFDELFGNLWIGKNPTEEHNTYQVLTLDFSQVGGKSNNLEENFNSYACFCLDNFMNRYGNAYPTNTTQKFYAADKAGDKLIILNLAAKGLGIKLYLIIDEYDNFTNTVLNEEGEAVYHAITHASGFYRDIFKKFKGMFDKIIMTGVSPVTLDDLTSGYNIGWNLSTDHNFNQMLGFSEEEVERMFTYYKGEGRLPADIDIKATIDSIKPWYDDYCFSVRAYESQSRVFNSDMVLFYLNHYINHGCPPSNLLDRNAGTDYDKIRRLIQLDQLDGDRRGLLHKIAEEETITQSVEESFPADQLTNPDIFPSLLFYYGMLTVKGHEGSTPILGIPNNNARKLYYNAIRLFFQQESGIRLGDLERKMAGLALRGEWRECLQYIADAYKNVSSVRDSIESERNIQGFFMAYLDLNKYYITAPELELNHGFCDFFLLPDPNNPEDKATHSYILELKVLHKKDDADKAKEQWAEAVQQINGYATAPRVEALRRDTVLHKIILQFEGGELLRMEEV